MKKKVFIYLAIAAVMINGVCRWVEKTSREEFQRQAGDRYANFEELKAHEKTIIASTIMKKPVAIVSFFLPTEEGLKAGSASLSARLTTISQHIYLKGKKMRTIQICT